MSRISAKDGGRRLVVHRDGSVSVPPPAEFVRAILAFERSPALHEGLAELVALLRSDKPIPPELRHYLAELFEYLEHRLEGGRPVHPQEVRRIEERREQVRRRMAKARTVGQPIKDVYAELAQLLEVSVSTVKTDDLATRGRG